VTHAEEGKTMASQIASSSQTFPFLTNSGSKVSNSTDYSSKAATPDFADMLRGQMRNSARTAETPSAERSPDQSARSESRSEPEGTSERSQQSQETDRADTSRSEPPERDTAADVHDAQPGNDEQTDAANEPAEAAMTIAGLPAAIAALLPGTRDLARAGTAATGADGANKAGRAANIALSGDTQGKSLQNSADSLPKPALNFAQTGQQGQSVLPLQLRPEAQSGFAERAATALQTVGADLPDGAQASFMHSLRQPGQVTTSAPQLTVATPAGQSAWADEVGNRVMWMVGRAESKAELVLTPPHLGKVEVSINLNGDQTTAQFIAATQSARDALEQAMPRLREILAQSGISLGQANVSTSGEQQTSGDDRGQRGGRGGIGQGDIDTGVATPAARWVKQIDGLVDTFA
jgi:flagellar hook-length control protein FliK